MNLLIKRRAMIDATLNRLQAKTRVNKRKVDTRRKILIGAVILKEMEKDPERIGAWVNDLLNRSLVKPRDRMLFDLDGPSPD